MILVFILLIHRDAQVLIGPPQIAFATSFHSMSSQATAPTVGYYPYPNYEDYALYNVFTASTAPVSSMGGPTSALPSVPAGGSQVPVEAPAETPTARGLSKGGPSACGGSGKSSKGRGNLAFSSASTPAKASAKAVPASELKYGTQALFLWIIQLASQFRLKAKETGERGEEQKQVSSPVEDVKGTVCGNADCCIDRRCKADNHNYRPEVRKVFFEAYKKQGLPQKLGTLSNHNCKRSTHCFTGKCLFNHGFLEFMLDHNPETGEKFDDLRVYRLSLSDYYIRKAIQNLEHVKSAINAQKKEAKSKKPFIQRGNTASARLSNNIQKIEDGEISPEEMSVHLGHMANQFITVCNQLCKDVRRSYSKKSAEFRKFFTMLSFYIPDIIHQIDADTLETLMSFEYMVDPVFDVDNSEEFPAVGNPLPRLVVDGSYLGALLTPSRDESAEPDVPIGELPDETTVPVLGGNSFDVLASPLDTVPPSDSELPIPATVEHPHDGAVSGVVLSLDVPISSPPLPPPPTDFSVGLAMVDAPVVPTVERPRHHLKIVGSPETFNPDFYTLTLPSDNQKDGLWIPVYVARTVVYFIGADGTIYPVSDPYVFGTQMHYIVLDGMVFLIDPTYGNTDELVDVLYRRQYYGYSPFGTADLLPVAFDQPPPVY